MKVCFHLWRCTQLLLFVFAIAFLSFSSVLIESEQQQENFSLKFTDSKNNLTGLQRKGVSDRGPSKSADDDYGYYDTEMETDDHHDDYNLHEHLSNHTSQDYNDDNPEYYLSQRKSFTKVVIGIVSCKNGTGTSTNYLEQTSLLFKSVLISAEIYNVSRVDFHLFLEEFEDEQYILERLEEMGYPSGYEQVDMNLIVHSAINVVPVRYRRHMVFQKKYRCGYTRFFFHTALPRVDAILYLSVDMLVTGNILKFWEFFGEMKGEQQMVGAVKNIGLESGSREFVEFDRAISSGADLPQIQPKGVNSGVLLMNLTKMREYAFDEKFLRAFQDYSKLSTKGSGPLTGQKVMNILLFYNPALFLPIPCNFNFAAVHCNGNGVGGRGELNYCLESAEEDHYGIQLIHVNSPYNFENGKNAAFQPLLRYFYQFNMTKGEKRKEDDIFAKELMIPIRTSYDRKSKASKCFRKLNNLLFKNFFDD